MNKDWLFKDIEENREFKLIMLFNIFIITSVSLIRSELPNFNLLFLIRFILKFNLGLYLFLGSIIKLCLIKYPKNHKVEKILSILIGFIIININFGFYMRNMIYFIIIFTINTFLIFLGINYNNENELIIYNNSDSSKKILKLNSYNELIKKYLLNFKIKLNFNYKYIIEFLLGMLILLFL